MAKLTIAFDPSDIVCAAWVDRKGVSLTNGKGAIDLADGDHKFAWMVLGEPDQAVTVTVGGAWKTQPTPIEAKVNTKHYASGASKLYRV